MSLFSRALQRWKRCQKRSGNTLNLIALGPSTGAEISSYGWSYKQAERPDADAIINMLEMWLSYDSITQ